MKTYPFHFFPILCLIVITSLMATSPIDLMPKDNEIPGWISDTTKCGWEGVAENIDQLYIVIDGPAEQYIPYGFNKGAFKGYIDTVSMSVVDTVATCIEIFDQTTHENALKVFETVGDTGCTYEFVLNLGDTARIDTNFIGSLCLEMVSQKFFIRLSVYNKDSVYKQSLLAMASSIDQKIETPIIFTNPEYHNKDLSFSIQPAKHSIIFSMKSNTLLNNNELSRISIYNTRGILIDRVILKKGGSGNMAIGIWNGTNRHGIKVSSGSYFAVVYLKDGYFSRKFILP